MVTPLVQHPPVGVAQPEPNGESYHLVRDIVQGMGPGV